MDDQRAACRGVAAVVAAFDACDDADPSGLGLEQLRLEAEFGERRAHVLGGIRLAVRLAVAVVRRVEPDEVAGNARGLIKVFVVHPCGPCVHVTGKFRNFSGLSDATGAFVAVVGGRNVGAKPVVRNRGALSCYSRESVQAENIQSGWRKWQTR